MIIVEGPDGSGKSTLVARLEGQLGITKEPRAVSKDAKSLRPIDDYIESELGKGFGMRLYDRFALISAPQYILLPDRTFRGRMTDVDWLRTQWHKFYRIDPVIVLCLPSLETVKGNTRVGVHDGLNLEEHIEAIYYGYLDWYAQQVGSSSVMLWDYHKPNQQRLDNLLSWAKARSDMGRTGV